MPKVSLYNQSGKSTEEIQLNDAVFGVKSKDDVVHQVYVALQANARQPWADTKDKGEVRGGGRKPWKQKGTGRARHGSIRSPLWTGGGVTFGPLKIRNFKQKINKKTNRLAVRMCLSSKVNEEKFIVLDELKSDGKTKNFIKLREKLPGFKKTTLILLDKKDDMLMRATGNIQKLDVKSAKDVSVVDLLHHQYIILDKKGVSILEKRLS